MWNVDNDIANPIQFLEIDTKEPAYHLYDYGIESMMVEHHSLDVSFGSQQVSISVTRKKFRSK